MSRLVGTWDFESSENWGEFLKELGVGMIMRKAAESVKPTIIINNNVQDWQISVQSTLKNVDTIARENVEFNECKDSRCFRPVFIFI